MRKAASQWARIGNGFWRTRFKRSVWQTVLRGRHPPSSVGQETTALLQQPTAAGRFESQTKAQFQWAAPKSGAPPPVPEEVVSAARARVVKLRTVLETLGEDDEMNDTLKASLRKAEMKAQENPLSTNQRHPCVHWSEVEAGGRGAAGQRQPSRKLLQRKKNKNDSSPMIGRILAQRADDAIAILSSACSHRSRCSGGSCQDAGDYRQIAGRIGDDEVRSGLRDGGGRPRRRYGGWATTQKVSSWPSTLQGLIAKTVAKCRGGLS